MMRTALSISWIGGKQPRSVSGRKTLLHRFLQQGGGEPREFIGPLW